MFYLNSFFLGSLSLLPAAALLDFLLGDPWNWPHPVQGMGWLIQQGQRIILDNISSARGRQFAGICLGGGIILGSAGVGGVVVLLATKFNLWLGGGTALVLLASCFAGRSLRQAADDVLRPLAQGNLPLARTCLSRYVGRDTHDLPVAEIYRAIFETVTENAIDGVLSPFFFAALGSALGVSIALSRTHFALGGPVLLSAPGAEALAWSWAAPVSLALAYKAASTLDSMIGYKTQPYRQLGWFSAQFEDRLTWLPCRLAVLSIALLSGMMRETHPKQVLRICQRDATLDPSPNSGWSETVYAAALGVQVGGDNYYQGVLKHKPHLGDNGQPITPERIETALRLTRFCFLAWLAIATFTLLLIQIHF